MNCHYIPRLLLRKFAENDRINSYNLSNEQITNKKIRDCFTETDLFPENIEQKFNKKIEGPFGSILNNKLLCNEETVELTLDEVIDISSYFIVQNIRSPFSNLPKNEERKYNRIKQYINETTDQIFGADIQNNEKSVFSQFLNFLGQYSTISDEEYYEAIEEFISHDYDYFSTHHIDSQQLALILRINSGRNFAIWDSSKCGEEFILPKMPDINLRDSGGPFNKSQTLINLLSDRHKSDKLKTTQKSWIADILELQKGFIDNYTVLPISPTRLLVSMNCYFELFFPYSKRCLSDAYIPKVLDRKQFYEHFPVDYPPRIELFEPHTYHNYNKVYKVKDLTKEEVYIINALSLNEEWEEFVFHDYDKIKNSIYAYENTIQMTEKMNDYKNLL